VGFITGAGEAMALVLRVVFGPLADRSGRYWTLTFAGYALTAVCVPALAITPFLAGAGLAVACLLFLAERAGKAVRSPAKTACLLWRRWLFTVARSSSMGQCRHRSRPKNLSGR
jgi:hypothetical protein